MKCVVQIITSGGVTYKNEPWHRECFTCTHCSTSLAGQRFTSRDEKPYCAECFGELFAKRCTACSKPITGQSSHNLRPLLKPRTSLFTKFSNFTPCRSSKLHPVQKSQTSPISIFTKITHSRNPKPLQRSQTQISTHQRKFQPFGISEKSRFMEVSTPLDEVVYFSSPRKYQTSHFLWNFQHFSMKLHIYILAEESNFTTC